jgi:hypothetical protein
MRQLIIIILVVALALLLPYSLKAQVHTGFKSQGSTDRATTLRALPAPAARPR